jgi:hypothetical protein
MYIFLYRYETWFADRRKQSSFSIFKDKMAKKIFVIRNRKYNTTKNFSVFDLNFHLTLLK